MTVICGNDALAAEIASLIDGTFVEVQSRVFPDGEVNPRLMISSPSDLEGDNVVLVLRKEPHEDINVHLVNVLLSLHNIRRYDPRQLICVMPYHPYARQDDQFRLGEPVSSLTVGKVLETLGVDTFLTVTSHLHRTKALTDFFERIDCHNISGIHPLAEFLRKRLLSPPEELFVLGPDEEALTFAEEAAEVLGTPNFGVLEKSRDRDTGDITQHIKDDLECNGKLAVIVDDIVSSGKTIANGAQMLRKAGAKGVVFAYVHAVHSPGAVDLLMKVNPELVVATDTLKYDARQGWLTVPIAPSIAARIKEVLF